MNAYAKLIANASDTSTAWAALNSQRTPGGGTGQQYNTYQALHVIDFTISSANLDFTIVPGTIDFSIAPYRYAFALTTYVNGVPV